MTATAEKSSAALVVRDIADGEFEVVRGGDVYRKWNGQPVPGKVKAGETVSAAEVCEWIEFGSKVDPRP